MLRVIRRIPDKRIPWRTRQNPEYKSCRFFNSHSKKFLFGSLPSVKTYSSHQHQTKKSGGGGTLLALSAFALAGGATLGYAKYDPDFRKVLVEYVPFTDTLIKILFVEEGEGNILSNTYGNIKSTIIDLVSGGSRSKTGRTVTPVPEPQEYKVGEVKPTSNEAEGFDTANLRELEDNICKSAEEAVNAYNKAVFILKTYNQDIEYIIDEAVNEIKPEMWDEVRRKTRSKQECIRRAQEKADEATKDINKLKEMVSSPKFDVPATTKDLIRTNISKVQEDIVKAKKELEAEQKSGSVTEKYWDKVEKARNHFSLELESLFPCIDISQKELRVNEEDLDLFVLHTYANVLFYQKELAKMETIIQEKVRQAVEAARKGGGEPLTNAQICEALDQEKRRLALCFQQQLLKVRKEADNELREQLKRQSQAFSDHLHEAINIKAEEIERVLTRKYDELLEAERCQYKIQLATAVGRLKGLDQAIREKKNAEETAKQAQVLWSACQSLLRAIKAGCPGMPWKSQIRPLEPEITAVRKAAAQNDELVSAVLNGIPKEAKERGVYPEDALRERFLKVEQVARTVALVPEDGAALPIHILSYLQSLLLIKAASPIPQSELNDEKVDFSKLDTNDILQRARYWLDRGDFAQTLKYMNLLKGAPRCVARQWMNETRILLETQQAANTLMAHAASSGLMYL
ncbi:MICOS complex subunit Mic60 isoform X2 [Anoplophora glabripennis]|uniref:MICOS complex subunit Mic60 isoform X2 n=1 Tax=Anoplophora glabripennis TaxID=217634 RepID=UPI00087467E1|nr:MICOS complex subunit Mic60 isoform X2 [Anoplophora glabripennis]